MGSHWRECADRSFDEVLELTSRLTIYYGDQEYNMDRFQLGRRHHKTLLKAYATSWRLHGELVVATVARRSAWQKRELALMAWYRQQLKEVIPPLIAKWETIIGEDVVIVLKKGKGKK